MLKLEKQRLLTKSASSRTKICSDCSTAFDCGAKAENQLCWCNKFPRIMPLDFEQDCRCPDCLKQVIVNKIHEFISTAVQQEIIDVASQYKDAGDLIEGIDYQIEEGLYVFSAWYHYKRGSCCGNGCKNCPFG